MSVKRFIASTSSAGVNDASKWAMATSSGQLAPRAKTHTVSVRSFPGRRGHLLMQEEGTVAVHSAVANDGEERLLAAPLVDRSNIRGLAAFDVSAVEDVPASGLSERSSTTPLATAIAEKLAADRTMAAVIVAARRRRARRG